MDIYDVITNELRRQKKTRKWLSEQTGIPYSSLQTLYSRRSKNISFENVAKIGAALNVDLKRFVDHVNDDKVLHSANYIMLDETNREFSGLFDLLNSNNRRMVIFFMLDLLKEQQKGGK